MRDSIKERIIWHIRKYADREAFERGKPYEVLESRGNVLLTQGADYIWYMICEPGTYNPLSADYAQIGVGSSLTGTNPDQTGLLGADTAYKGMVEGAPVYGDDYATFESQFDEDEGNFAWNEFVVTNGTLAINRHVESQGTKTQGSIWVITVDLQLS